MERFGNGLHNASIKGEKYVSQKKGGGELEIPYCTFLFKIYRPLKDLEARD